MTDLPEVGQLFDVDVDLSTRMLTLVALDRRLELKIPESAQAQPVQDPRHNGERSIMQPGEVPEMQPLMLELDGAMQVLPIWRPPLGAANTA